MAAAIAHVFPNTAHRLCLWHIGQNAVKHLGPIIKAAEDKAEDKAEDEAEDKSGNKFNKFWADFKSCIYEDRAEIYFTEKCDELLAKYNLEDNTWMSNLYALRAKWAAVYRDSFTADMHSTQRSEGMNNVFKKTFRRKLCLLELLVECENVIVTLRSNEKDADFQSRRKIPVCYIPNLPMLKTAAETYTRRMYSDFEEEFKKQFMLSCELLEGNGTNSTFFVKYMQSERGATVVLNKEDSTITCSCRMFECIVRPGSGADAMRACVRARAGSKPAREPSRAMGQAGSARYGEPRFRARDPHVRRRAIVARHEGVRTQRPVRAALTGFLSAWLHLIGHFGSSAGWRL
ncbi:hypothetical protein PVAP13_1NG113519 [Panicum virgatum]|uniref:Protein FAR1-RELATED SEQUENCE n=1 Tax=Panicum virgatum TaxID=38727 RepID=A0A8T0WUW1_PANVG|nr:hypothetical protein PVAP13_1NG113519 [Panicum virgatum]